MSFNYEKPLPMYDPEEDTVYIGLSHSLSARSLKVSESTTLDLDVNGAVIGVEIREPTDDFIAHMFNSHERFLILDAEEYDLVMRILKHLGVRKDPS